MKKYILLFVLAFAIAGISNAQTTDTKAEATKVATVKKLDSKTKAATISKVEPKTAKSASCKDMAGQKGKSCCKKGDAKASANAEKACCANMAEAKDGKACCDKMADKKKAEAKKEAAKKG